MLVASLAARRVLPYLLGATAAFSSGCALGPSTPAGPITGSGTKLGATWGASYSPVTVDAVTTPNDGDATAGQPASFTSNGGAYAAPGTIFPMHATVRGSISTYFDAGVDPGLVQTGLYLRGGALDARRYLPWGIQLEWRGPGPIRDLNQKTNIFAGRVELYPHFFDRRIVDGYWVIALGASTGQQYQFLHSVPERYIGHLGAEESASAEVVSRETRLEGAFGIHYRFGPGMVTAALMPYFVLARSGLVDAKCHSCNLDITSSRTGDFGFTLLVAPGAALEKRPE